MTRSKQDFNRYHHDIYFPEDFPNMVVEFIESFKGEVDLTTHAAEQLYDKKDPRGPIPLPTNEELLDNRSRIVEFYERINHLGRIQKIVIRIGHLNEKYDYTYVVARDGVIVTAWANSKTDAHRLTKSLDEYYCPEEMREAIFEKHKKRIDGYKKIDNK